MSCEGCNISLNGMQQQLSTVRKSALKWQKDNKISVAIYLEGYDYYFMNAQTAINEGKLIKEILTIQ